VLLLMFLLIVVYHNCCLPCLLGEQANMVDISIHGSGWVITTSGFRKRTSTISEFYPRFSVFTPLHEMQTRSSYENSVCPSVCLSNACIVTQRNKDMSRLLYHAKDHL